MPKNSPQRGHLEGEKALIYKALQTRKPHTLIVSPQSLKIGFLIAHDTTSKGV